MDAPVRRKVVAGAAAALAVGGAGAGIAATKLSHSPRQESQAVVNDAAKQLGVEPSKLGAALKKAYEDRVDAAVADGRISKAEGEALKQRIESEGLPLVRAAARVPSLRLPRPRLRLREPGCGQVPGPEREPARVEARVRQDARAGRQGAGQVGRRPRRRAQERPEAEARPGSRSRAVDEVAGTAVPRQGRAGAPRHGQRHLPPWAARRQALVRSSRRPPASASAERLEPLHRAPRDRVCERTSFEDPASPPPCRRRQAACSRGGRGGLPRRVRARAGEPSRPCRVVGELSLETVLQRREPVAER